MALTSYAEIVDLATYREAAAHPCHYCGRPCPENDRLPRVILTSDFLLAVVDDPKLPAPESQVHAACAMRAELGRGFGFAP